MGGAGRTVACFAGWGADDYAGANAEWDQRRGRTAAGNLIVVWMRRQYPALQWVPARWIRPAVAPAAVRLRRLLWRGVLAAATPIGLVVVLLIVKR
jgi:hypothetical protein